MKKILFAVDGTNFSLGAFAFIRQLNEKEQVMATGIFVPQLDISNLWSYASASRNGAVFVPLVEEEISDTITENITRFESLCKEHAIEHRVHKDFFDFALPALKRETRFADLMVLSGELFYRQLPGKNQLDYLRQALHHSECPVLIVPETFRFPDKNILAYDGSEESVYAIKQFAYIFPELAGNKTLLVHVADNQEKTFPEKDLVLELAKQHYKNLSLLTLQLDRKKDFSSWMADRKDSILVSGSFGRTSFSEAFRKSFVFDVVQEHLVPVFIAHK